MVCCSELTSLCTHLIQDAEPTLTTAYRIAAFDNIARTAVAAAVFDAAQYRSEERRVGKEC